MAPNDDYEAKHQSRDSLRKIATSRQIRGAGKLSSKGDCVTALRQYDESMAAASLPVLSVKQPTPLTAVQTISDHGVSSAHQDVAPSASTTLAAGSAASQQASQFQQNQTKCRAQQYNGMEIHALRKRCQRLKVAQWWKLRREDAIQILQENAVAGAAQDEEEQEQTDDGASEVLVRTGRRRIRLQAEEEDQERENDTGRNGGAVAGQRKKLKGKQRAHSIRSSSAVPGGLHHNAETPTIRLDGSEEGPRTTSSSSEQSAELAPQTPNRNPDPLQYHYPPIDAINAEAGTDYEAMEFSALSRLHFLRALHLRGGNIYNAPDLRQALRDDDERRGRMVGG